MADELLNEAPVLVRVRADLPWLREARRKMVRAFLDHLGQARSFVQSAVSSTWSTIAVAIAGNRSDQALQ